ncbi:MAG: DUF805 domain-containing protein, partial [Mucilaginibacter sp.]
MFKAPFSFEGRIRRKEYAITYVIFDIIALVLGYVTSDGVEGIFLLMYIVIIVALLWIKLAQAAKRCHDRNNPGWFQLIPFYEIWLLFGDGDKRRNEYG